MGNRRKAFEFVLKDEDGKEIRLSDFKGKWLVLYFYPRDNTPGCTTEALEFTSLVDGFAGCGAVVVGVSPDSCESHQKFKVRHNLGVRLLSDPERGLMEHYGAWGEKKMYGKLLKGVIRSTVLIDPDGTVAHQWPRVRAKGHAANVLDTLRKLIASDNGTAESVE